MLARVARCSITCVAAVVLVAAGGVGASAAATSTIAGVAYFDRDGDGVRQADEAAASDHRLYLFDASGSYVAQAVTDASGSYRFSGLADGDYRIEYDAASWSPLKDQWVPGTLESVWPRASVSLAGAATVDFGWRPIVWSTDIHAPVSTYQGPEGLRVESFNDAVAAREVYDAVRLGHIGAEASFTTVRFAYGTSSWTGASVVRVGETYRDFHANVYVTYASWLESWDQTLGHEYGHAWSLYHAYLVQADETIAGYLAARGLADDERVDSSYAWGRGELIAEDYRQLLGSPNARRRTQANREIPPAAEIPGLREYLLDVFSYPPSDDAAPGDADGADEQTAPVLEIAELSMTLDKRGGTASFAVTLPAAATVEIRSPDGARVRTLASELAVPAGRATALRWDRTDDAGKRVRRGTYLLHVVATDDAGGVATDEVAFEIS